ncbi:hypothetical protein BASA81_004099 [Batrachochytrium salamandrivorans]|nr:hypothetical protein BASA81_004099 [Batrachochytrium salamandrivorans]
MSLGEEELVLRAFPRTGQWWLDRGAAASLGSLLRQFPVNSQVLRIGQLTSSSQSFSPQSGELTVLLGKVAFSPKREGYLMLQEDDRSNPIALPVQLKRPELLNALVVVDNWAAVPTVNWPEDSVVVDPGEWLPHDHPTPKRQRMTATSSKRFYIECKSIRVLATARDTHYGNGGCCQGMIIGMSALFRDDQGAEYWIIELANDVCVVCFGNQALRHVLRVGATYQFSNCTSKRLGLGGGMILQAYVCSAEELKVCLLEDGLPLIPLTALTTTPQVNLFHYEGRVTAHPAAFVLELDGKFKVFLHQLPKVYLWFGLRVGCLVRFRALCQVNMGGEMIGFESTWRTGMDVVEFAPPSNSNKSQIRFPHTNAQYQHIATLHLYFALDLVAKLVPVASDPSSLVWFHQAVQYCARRFPSPVSTLSSPVMRFLYDWEVPLTSSPNVPKLTTLQRVVSEALKRGSDLASCDHVLLCNLHVSSVVTNQLCLAEPNLAVVECVLRETNTSLGWKLITKFSVVVERFAASNVVSTTVSLDPLHSPIESKGRCLWYGHVNGNDQVGLTRVFIRVLECEDFATDSGLPPPLQQHSTFFSFDEQGQLTYSTHALPSINSKEVESISTVYATERCPTVLTFVLLSVQVTQARKFNLAYENQRRAKLDKLGVFPSFFFSEYSLKLVGRDLHSPLELDIFLPLQGRVLPPGLTTLGSCWQLSGGTAMIMKSNKLYISASNTAVIVPCQLPIATFPQDLLKLDVDYLCNMRYSGAQKPWRGGGCVSLHLTKLLSAHLMHVCACAAATAGGIKNCGMTSQCFSLSCLAEVDDGSDQAQAFAENDVACALLGLDWPQVLTRCGRHAARLKRLDFKQVAQCEPNSPQGEFRDLVGIRTNLAPMRAFLIRDSPFPGKSPSSSFRYSVEGEDEGDEGGEDYSKVAYVKTWDEAKVLTAIRPRLSLKLLAVCWDDLEVG